MCPNLARGLFQIMFDFIFFDIPSNRHIKYNITILASLLYWGGFVCYWLVVILFFLQKIKMYLLLRFRCCSCCSTSSCFYSKIICFPVAMPVLFLLFNVIYWLLPKRICFPVAMPVLFLLFNVIYWLSYGSHLMLTMEAAIPI